MASPPQTTKSTSRWGTFLQQAVAGVESRLDTILADEDTTSKDTKRSEQPTKKESLKVPASTKVQQEGIARSRSSSKNNDRLQERLAKAIINRNGTRTGESSAPSSSLPSRTASPSHEAGGPRASLDLGAEKPGTIEIGFPQERVVQSDEFRKLDHVEGSSDNGAESQPENEPPSLASPPETSQDNSARPSMDSRGSISKPSSFDMDRSISQTGTYGSAMSDADKVPKAEQHSEDMITQMRSDYKTSELRRQEETHFYLERIDALESKLQYLAKEAADGARKASSEAGLGSMDQKLAAKDEKIALLMEEGQKLSQTELKHLNTIKKLRVKLIEDEKKLADVTKKLERSEKLAGDSHEKDKRAEAAEARATERLKTLPAMEKELEALKAERNHNVAIIEHLQGRITEATAMIEATDQRAQVELLEAERRLTTTLEDDISNAKIEKELSDERHRGEIRDLKEKLERERERAKVVELEMQGEQAVLESRMEALRARAEEVSTGSTGDAQAKLLRQVETLQNQYAVASENWQGIEASLLARVAGLERDRDEVSRRESEVRRKARETNIKSRRLEGELEKTSEKLQWTERELSEQSVRLDLTNKKLTKLEADLTNARAELRAERETWDARLAQRLEAENTKFHEENVPMPEGLYRQFRAESPVFSNKRGNATSPHGRRAPRQPSLADIGVPTSERPRSRRASGQPLRSAGLATLYRYDSPLSINGVAPETPSVQTEHQEDFFDGVGTPVTSERTINDMISVSTAAAGPSVQLVERMSAAVRRLESEKAASKDELGRLSVQRDEARDQVVALMREIEEKRASDERSRALEAEIAQLNERYQTTLEMLGEKSELVEELRADVADVKKIYRELIDSTMR